VTAPVAVRTIDLNGTTFVLPIGVEPSIKFQDHQGKLHDTPALAELANARHTVEVIVNDAINWRDEELHVDEIIDNRRELIVALNIIAEGRDL
jgi:hypothetical protein